MSLFSYIKNQLSILELAREYTALTRAGQYWRGRCPLHNERTASFTISEHKQIFYCFGCTAGGDIITLVSKKENCSPMEAASLLIERYNLTPPQTEFTSAHKKEIDDKKRYFVINDLLAQWCHENLAKNSAALAYLQHRGISAASIQLFRLGYFPGGPEAINHCLAFMRKQSILADDLVSMHILAKGKSSLYSPFEERIIFPIRDHLKRMCGFGGRVFRSGDTRAKYYNSRENPHFIKGSLLFGFDQAKQAIQKTGIAFLVEGYTDCIAMVQYGYTNTLATLGTACTQEHLTMLARYAQKLYVLYDGDKAGQEAIMRLTKLCWLVDMELYAITLPPGQDPASVLTKGASLEPFIAQARDIFTFFISSIGSDFESKPLAHKLSLVRQLLAVITSLDDVLKQGLLLDKAAQTLNLPLPSLQQELARMTKSANPQPALEQAPSIPEQPTKGLHPLEIKIFSSIMHNMQLLSTAGSNTREYLSHHLCQPLASLVHQACTFLEQGQDDFFSFFDTLEEDQKRLISNLIAREEGVHTAQEFGQLVVQLQKRNWKVMVNAMKEQVAQATKRGDNAHAARIIKEFLMLKQRYYTTLSD